MTEDEIQAECVAAELRLAAAQSENDRLQALAFPGAVVLEITEKELGSVITEFFLDKYRIEYLARYLNRGTDYDPDWVPDYGMHVQARANAEQIIERLRGK